MSKAMKIFGLFSLLCLLGAGPEGSGLGSLKFEESSNTPTATNAKQLLR